MGYYIVDANGFVAPAGSATSWSEVANELESLGGKACKSLAEEGYVNIDDLMKELNAIKTPSMNRFAGSIFIPPSLKLIPRYPMDPATSIRRIKALMSPFFKAKESLLAKILWKLSGCASKLRNCNKDNPIARPSWLESKAAGNFPNVR